jgi:hypothetical protein
MRILIQLFTFSADPDLDPFIKVMGICDIGL